MGSGGCTQEVACGKPAGIKPGSPARVLEYSVLEQKGEHPSLGLVGGWKLGPRRMGSPGPRWVSFSATLGEWHGAF